MAALTKKDGPLLGRMVMTFRESPEGTACGQLAWRKVQKVSRLEMLCFGLEIIADEILDPAPNDCDCVNCKSIAQIAETLVALIERRKSDTEGARTH